MNSRLLKLTLFGCFALVLASSMRAQTNDDNAVLTTWLAHQTNIQTWSADFTQTRSLKALTKPLIATGHIWFAAPNRFRWEIKEPSPTIAVRQPDELWVVYPRLKRAEEYPLNAAAAGPFKDTLALLDAGFPRDRVEIESHFNILHQATDNGIHELALQPKSEAARKFMPQIKIAFDIKTFMLHSTELQFTDGSTMANIFTNPELNPKIDDSTFIVETNGYKIVHPFK